MSYELDTEDNEIPNILKEVYGYIEYFKDKDIIKDSRNDFYIFSFHPSISKILDVNYDVIHGINFKDNVVIPIWRNNHNTYFINDFLTDHYGKFMLDASDFLYRLLFDIVYLIEVFYNDERIKQKYLRIYIIQLVDIYRRIKLRYEQ